MFPNLHNMHIHSLVVCFFVFCFFIEDKDVELGKCVVISYAFIICNILFSTQNILTMQHSGRHKCLIFYTLYTFVVNIKGSATPF